MATAENEVITVLTPVARRMLTETEVLIQKATLKAELVSQEEDEAALAGLKMIVAQRKAMDEQRKTETRALREQITAINDQFAPFLDTLERLERDNKAKHVAWMKRCEDERVKAADEEAKRIARNAEKRAERAESKGDDYTAEEIRIQAELEAEHARAAIATQEAPKADGVSTRKNWKAEVTDADALIKAIAAGSDPRLHAQLVKPDPKELKRLAGLVQDRGPAVPGVRIFADDVVSVRS